MLDVQRGLAALGVVYAVSAGSHQWSRVIGEPAPGLEVRIRSVAGHRTGGALVAGSVVGQLASGPSQGSSGKDLFVALLDASGASRQSLLLGGSGPRELASATFDPRGNVILAGQFTGTLDLDGMHLATPPGGGSSGFVASLDPSGHARWLKQLSAERTTPLTIHGAAGDARGNVVVIGHVDGKAIFFDGAPLPAADKFAIQLDPSGRVAWTARLRYGVADTLPPAIDPSGNTVVAFVSEDQEKIHLIKLDPAGNMLWREKLGGGITQALTGLAIDSAGNILLTGRGGLGDAPPDGEPAFIARLDPEGHVITVRRGPRMTYVGVAAGDRDRVITAGGAPELDAFGGVRATGSGPRFVAELDTSLRPRWVSRIEGDVDPTLAVAAIPGEAALVAGSFRGPITLFGRRIPGRAGVNAFAAALAP